MPRKYKHLIIGAGLITFRWNKCDVIQSNNNNISHNSAFLMEEDDSNKIELHLWLPFSWMWPSLPQVQCHFYMHIQTW